MDEDELPTLKPDSLLAKLCAEDLSAYDVEDLRDRITSLEAEMKRIHSEIEKKASGLAAAEALFR